MLGRLYHCLENRRLFDEQIACPTTQERVAAAVWTAKVMPNQIRSAKGLGSLWCHWSTAHTRMSDTRNTVRMALGLRRAESMGGPLVVVPVSALHHWGGCTEDGVIVGGTDQPDDYDRACEVEDYAEVISLRGHGNVSALMLGDEPATTCYLPEQRVFMRWLAADSDTELLAAAEAVLNDPATP